MEKSMSKRKSSSNTSFVSKISCFTASNSKPVQASVQPGNESNEFGNHQTNKTEGGLCKLKVSAHKIYASVKKMNQTISSGGQFTNFISGIFTSGGDRNDLKKIKESYLNEGCPDDVNADVKKSLKYKRTSTCPSASSITRSCFSKSSPNSRHKRNTRMEKRVRLCHVDVEVEGNCHQTNSRQPKLPDVDHKRNDVITNSREPNLPHRDHEGNDVMKNCEDLKNYEFVLDFLRTRMMMFEDDCSIDWRSDLVEIERLSSFKNSKC
ncbi:hypothetical protein POM88_032744 [Heracleum sosnowskyi]|uniref:Uncharacterized protein n=1 Tax=Heracleum sosnowskyi TaxID=360622 RepID=A0AAD8I086_9APIA|nr:hypothetical protein POM88_032744 [Heracleum sosnowskyi]